MDPFSLERAALDAADRVALVTEGRSITYGELAKRCAAIADDIERRRGEGRGPVAVGAVNHGNTALVLLSLIDRGIPIVPLHPRLTEREADALVRDARCSLVIDRELASSLVALGPSVDRSRSRPALDPEAPLAILYTSGTTGNPKGAVLSRRAFAASAAASAENLRWLDDDRWLLCLPLCHVGGLSVLTRCTAARKTVILLPRFDEAAVLDAIARESATIASFVPTMLHRLVDAGHESALASLRAVLLGGAAAPGTLLERCARARIRVRTTYGLTEACSQVTTQRERAPGALDLSSGEPLSGVEVEIRDDRGERARAGDVGAIVLRGPTLFSGYLHGDPRANGDWFDTGDFGFFDEQQRLHVVARRTDLIVTGGENVYPLEVERALGAAKGVAGVMVFGVSDERWGQLVACAIVTDSGAGTFDARAFAAECEKLLAPHKRPRLYVLCDELPLTNAGKPDRRAASALFEGRFSTVSTRDRVRSSE